MTVSLYKLSANYRAAYLDLANMDLPDEVINDTLEAMDGELELKMANVGAFIKNLEAEKAMIDSVKDEMAAKSKVLGNKVDRLKEYLRLHMEATGTTEVKAIDSTFTIKLLKARSSLKIDDFEKVPDEYKIRYVETNIDNAGLKAALEEGVTMDCAHLEWKSGLKIS